MGYSEITPKSFAWFVRNQSLSPWDSAVTRFEGIPKATFIIFSFFFRYIFIIFVYFYFLQGIHCIVWIGFAEEKFLEVAQELNKIKLDGYQFFTKCIKKTVQCKICRIWLVDIAELWVDREAEKGFYDGVWSLREHKTGGVKIRNRRPHGWFNGMNLNRGGWER